MTPAEATYELRVKRIVYDAVARALPAMGKDFTVDVTVARKEGERAGISLIITPFTAMGRAILPTLKEEISKELARLEKQPHDTGTTDNPGGSQ